MTDKDQNPPSPEVIDEQTIFTMVELCRCCAVEAEFIEAMVEHGILEPLEDQRIHYSFPAVSLRRTRVTIRLQRDLGVNLPGAALALDLLERIEELDARLQREGERQKGL
jgi:chaperone modulatory protein CbpM